jgi:hypothetical protein
VGLALAAGGAERGECGFDVVDLAAVEERFTGQHGRPVVPVHAAIHDGDDQHGLADTAARQGGTDGDDGGLIAGIVAHGNPP